MASEPPPRPPPHGQNPQPPGGAGAGAGREGGSSSGLPNGNYDIFIVPPHSAGSGFLYLPSMQVRRNSFLAGVACALFAVGVYSLIMPALKEFLASLMASGGVGVLFLMFGVGVTAWAWGKTQAENSDGPGFGFGFGGGNASAGHQQQQQNNQQQQGQQHQHQQHQQSSNARPNGPQPNSTPKPSAASGWEKAREETRKREEARKREEEAKKKRDDAAKAKEEADRAAKAKAEKDKWEQARAREKEQREREARERIAREREAREKAAKTTPSGGAGNKSSSSAYHKPTARSYDGTEEEYSYRPYDSARSHPTNGPKPPRHGPQSSASSMSGLSDGSYAPSHTTARTTPPPSSRGPYSTSDPDKIQIKAVYLFTEAFPTKPQASLIAKTGHVTDGLILRIKTEGLFIDDDVRSVPQREWDIKAWTMKLVEDGMARRADGGVCWHVLRVTMRDAEGRRFVFVLDEGEAWKVAVGLGRLRKGSQVRALGMSGLKEGEVRGLLGALGWM